MKGRKIKEVAKLIYTKLGKIKYPKLGKIIIEIIFGPLYDKVGKL